MGHALALLPGEHHSLVRFDRKALLELLEGPAPDHCWARLEQRLEDRERLDPLRLSAQREHSRLWPADFQPRSLRALKQVCDSLGPRNASRLYALEDEEDRRRHCIALEDRIRQVEVVGKAVVERDRDRAAGQGTLVQNGLDDLAQRQHPVVSGQVGDVGRKPLLEDPRKEWIFPGNYAMGAEDDGTAPGKPSRDQAREAAIVKAPAEQRLRERPHGRPSPPGGGDRGGRPGPADHAQLTP